MTLAEFEEARGKRKEASERVAKLLQEMPTTFKGVPGLDGLRMRGQRMAKCGDFYAGEVCPVCGEFHAERGSRCRDRLCPNCGWLNAVQRAITMRRAISALGDKFAIYHVVLTMRDPLAADGPLLHSQCESLVKAYTKLVHQDRRFKTKVWGTVRCLEISDNGKSRFHPHIHALWLYKIPHPWTDGKFFSHAQVCQMWRDALGVDYIPVCWIEPIYFKVEMNVGGELADVVYNPSGEEGMEQATIDRAVCEACKYAIKPSLYNTADAAKLLELSQGIKGVHMFQITGGLSAEYRKAEKEMQDEQDHPQGHCRKCNALTEKVYLNWMNGGYVL